MCARRPAERTGTGKPHLSRCMSQGRAGQPHRKPLGRQLGDLATKRQRQMPLRRIRPAQIRSCRQVLLQVLDRGPRRVDCDEQPH
jgi:hypothetical protein